MSADEHVVRAAKTIKDMMNARGYREITDLSMIAGDGPQMAFTERRNNRVVVKWLLPSNSRIGVKDTRLLVEEMNKANIKHVIMVVAKDLTSFACNELSNCSLRIEKWLINNLQVNPLTFFLTPEHRMLTLLEKKALGIKHTKLPRMMLSDAIARFYGARKGNIFEIKRISPDGFQYTVYRIVV